MPLLARGTNRQSSLKLHYEFIEIPLQKLQDEISRKTHQFIKPLIHIPELQNILILVSSCKSDLVTRASYHTISIR